MNLSRYAGEVEAPKAPRVRVPRFTAFSLRSAPTIGYGTTGSPTSSAARRVDLLRDQASQPIFA